MNLPEFLYFFIERDGRSLTETNGVFDSTPARVPLPDGPVGDKDIAIGWERSTEEAGVVRNFTFPLTFFGKAARILKNIAYNEHFEREVFFLITWIKWYFTDTVWGHIYEFFYKGELDFTTFKDHSPTSVTVTVGEGGVARKKKANEGTAYEVGFDVLDAITVKIDGPTMQERHNFLVNAHPGIDFSHFLGFGETSVDGRAGGFAGLSQFYETPSISINDLQTSTAYGFYSDVPLTLHIKGAVNVKATQGASFYTIIIMSNKGKSAGDPSSIVYLVPERPLPNNQFTLIPFDITIPAAAGERFFVDVTAGISGGNLVYQESTFFIEFARREPATFVPAYMPAVFNRKLAGKYLGDEAATSSSILAAERNFCITSGAAVRGLLYADPARGIPEPVIKTTARDWLTHCRVAYGAGTGIEGEKVVIEPYDHFYRTDNPIQLGEVAKLEPTPATEYMANTYRVGWPNPNINDVNGQYAFNGSSLYSSPRDKVVREHTLVSPYVTDPYKIEDLRIKNIGKETTDAPTDNEVVILDVDVDNPVLNDPIHGTYYNLRRLPYDSIEGTPAGASLFNVELSPARLVRKHQRLFNSMLYGHQGKSMTFQTADRNPKLRTTAGAVTIAENADLIIGTDRLFLPWFFDFDTLVPDNYAAIMEEDPNRCYEFTWRGVTYQGFLRKTGIHPGDHTQQSFRLLATPNNDLSKLVPNG